VQALEIQQASHASPAWLQLKRANTGMPLHIGLPCEKENLERLFIHGMTRGAG